MSIPSYQIHNVLKVFSRHLVKCENESGDGENLSSRSLIRQLPISEGKRAAVVERVAEDILKKIAAFRRTPTTVKAAPQQGRSAMDPRRFRYNTIEPDGSKVTRTMQDAPKAKNQD
jgi:hypothetical protein